MLLSSDLRDWLLVQRSAGPISLRGAGHGGVRSPPPSICSRARCSQLLILRRTNLDEQVLSSGCRLSVNFTFAWQDGLFNRRHTLRWKSIQMYLCREATTFFKVTNEDEAKVHCRR